MGNMDAFILTSTAPHVAMCSSVSYVFSSFMQCNIKKHLRRNGGQYVTHTHAHTHTHTHTHTKGRGAGGAHRCGNTWFLQAALRAHHFLSRLDSCTFCVCLRVSPVTAAGTTESWAGPGYILTSASLRTTRQNNQFSSLALAATQFSSVFFFLFLLQRPRDDPEVTCAVGDTPRSEESRMELRLC